MKICKKCNKKKEADDFPTDNSAKDKLWRFCRYCEYLRKHPTNPLTEKEWRAKKNAPKAKKTATKKTKKNKDIKVQTKVAAKKHGKKETVADLEKRIADLSPSSTGIHIKNVTPKIKQWAETEGYGWETENILYIGKKAV